jgi:hypothetical protein
MSQTYKQNSNELSKQDEKYYNNLKKRVQIFPCLTIAHFGIILSGHSLNSQGLKMKKVLTYLKDLLVEMNPLKAISS